MEAKTLYFVREEEDGGEILEWDVEFCQFSRLAEPAEITLERMADLLDLHAESINAHDFVLTHMALAALLYQQIGRAEATRVMRRLVDFGGLHGLTGVCGSTDPAVHEQELGVPLNGWKEWQLPD